MRTFSTGRNLLAVLATEADQRLGLLAWLRPQQLVRLLLLLLAPGHWPAVAQAGLAYGFVHADPDLLASGYWPAQPAVAQAWLACGFVHAHPDPLCLMQGAGVALLQKHSSVEGDSEQATLLKLRHGAA